MNESAVSPKRSRYLRELRRQNRRVRLYLDDEVVASRKRPVMAPGEMEELKLTKEALAAHPDLKRIHIAVEEA